ncbi:MAG: ankyrin repeat domain-containing protein, partial [Chloroflexota bacterium]
FWGHREASELLALSGVVPRNLRVAAALGRKDLVDECFTPDKRLTAAARTGRGFYRPHSGFPFWRPSDDPQEVLDEALVWASKSDRVEVMPLLVERGANVSADLYRGTPLLWAAANGCVRAATWLLEHGVDVNSRATFGGMTHGQDVTALHLAAQNGHLGMAELLVAHGADATIEDAIYHSSPAGWAAHFGATEVATYLQKAAGAYGRARTTDKDRKPGSSDAS